ncbi:unnamed protein product [Amoebophrya sp. A25]|nr:unnamed protein product [Amoebophrya sp. A25]|eukprot:GSA25T00016943001.1
MGQHQYPGGMYRGAGGAMSGGAEAAALAAAKEFIGNEGDPDAENPDRSQRPQGDWTLQMTAQGSQYYWNTKTGESRWMMPEELMTPLQLKIAKLTPWRAIPLWGDKVYYYNMNTRVACWRTPEVVEKIQEGKLDQIKDDDEEREEDEILTEQEKRTKYSYFLRHLITTTLAEEEIGDLTFLRVEEAMPEDQKIVEKRIRRQCFAEYLSAMKKERWAKQEQEKKEGIALLEKEMQHYLEQAERAELASGVNIDEVQLPFVRFETLDATQFKHWGCVSQVEHKRMFYRVLAKFLQRREKRMLKRQQTLLPQFHAYLCNHEKINPSLTWEEAFEIVGKDRLGRLFVSELGQVEALRIWKTFIEMAALPGARGLLHPAVREDRLARQNFLQLLREHDFLPQKMMEREAGVGAIDATSSTNATGAGGGGATASSSSSSSTGQKLQKDFSSSSSSWNEVRSAVRSCQSVDELQQHLNMSGSSSSIVISDSILADPRIKANEAMIAAIADKRASSSSASSDSEEDYVVVADSADDEIKKTSASTSGSLDQQAPFLALEDCKLVARMKKHIKHLHSAEAAEIQKRRLFFREEIQPKIQDDDRYQALQRLHVQRNTVAACSSPENIYVFHEEHKCTVLQLTKLAALRAKHKSKNKGTTGAGEQTSALTRKRKSNQVGGTGASAATGGVTPSSATNEVVMGTTSGNVEGVVKTPSSAQQGANIKDSPATSAIIAGREDLVLRKPKTGEGEATSGKNEDNNITRGGAAGVDIDDNEDDQEMLLEEDEDVEVDGENLGGVDADFTALAGATKRRRFVNKTMRMTELKGERTVIVNAGAIKSAQRTTPVVLEMNEETGTVVRSTRAQHGSPERSSQHQSQTGVSTSNSGSFRRKRRPEDAVNELVQRNDPLAALPDSSIGNVGGISIIGSIKQVPKRTTSPSRGPAGTAGATPTGGSLVQAQQGDLIGPPPSAVKDADALLEDLALEEQGKKQLEQESVDRATASAGVLVELTDEAGLSMVEHALKSPKAAATSAMVQVVPGGARRRGQSLQQLHIPRPNDMPDDEELSQEIELQVEELAPPEGHVEQFSPKQKAQHLPSLSKAMSIRPPGSVRSGPFGTLGAAAVAGGASGAAGSGGAREPGVVVKKANYNAFSPEKQPANSAGVDEQMPDFQLGENLIDNHDEQDLAEGAHKAEEQSKMRN